MIIVGVSFLAVICVSFVVWLLIDPKKPNVKNNKEKERAASEQAVRHRENIAKVLNMAQISHRITNDDVEKTLGVSDSTATRYLQELEDRGKIEQVGKEGRYVFYQAKHF